MAVAPEANMPTPNVEAVPYGLRTSVPGPSETPKKWEAGFVLKAESCEGSYAWDPCSDGSAREKATQETHPDEVVYQPFVVNAPIECSSFGFEAADYVGRAERLLEATSSAAIEREFWTGEIMPGNQSLMGTPNTDERVLNPGGAADPISVSPAQALILLSGALSSCLDGTRGVIHATTPMVEAWLASGMIHADDGHLVTGARRDIVVAGAGYTGHGPYGQPVPEANHAWVYGTSMVNVIVGQPEVIPSDISEALDRRTNTVTYRGEQTAAAFHDGCCAFAVYVDFTPYVADVIACDSLVPVLYDGDAESYWLEDGTPLGIPGNALFFGIPAGLVPDQGTTEWTLEIAYASGIETSPPTVANVPQTWTTIATLNFPMFVGVSVASLGFIGLGANDPFWLGGSFVDAQGCTYRVSLFFAEGIPETWLDDVPGYVTFDGGDTWQLVVTPGGTEDPTVVPIVDWSGDCPDPVKAMAVKQACDDVWNVQLSGEAATLEPRIVLVANNSVSVVGFRSVTVTTTVGAAVVTNGASDSVSIPEGVSLTWGVDFQADAMNTLTVTTGVGEEAIVSWTVVV